MAFRFVRFVSFRFVSFVFVPSATAFPGSQSTITHLDDVYDKMGRKRLKKLLFLPFGIEDEEEDCVHRIGGSGSVKSLPKGVNKENFTTSFRRCVWWILKVISGT